LTDTVIAIDNLYGKAHIISMAQLANGHHANGRAGERANGRNDDVIDQAFKEANDKIDAIIQKLDGPLLLRPLARSPVRQLASSPARPLAEARSTYTQTDFMTHVERIREYIRAGDVFQVVLSQRLEVP